MIDVLIENLIDLREAAKSPAFRRNGKAPHLSAVHRWTTHGARAANGERVRLSTVRTPSGLKTSSEAIVRFINELTDPDRPVPTPRSRVRDRELAQADASLASAGMI